MTRTLDSARRPVPGGGGRFTPGPRDESDRATAPSFRRRLGASLASAAGPYGYTISLGGSIALATERLGSPHLAGALLLMLGAVLAFVMLGAGAQGSLAASEPLAGAPPTVWGNAHIPSAGVALCAVWGVDHVATGTVGWLLTGFAATAVYLVVCAVQQLAAGVLRRRARVEARTRREL